MTSRERVRAVINGQVPDVVPTDLWGCASRIHNNLYEKLRVHFGIDKPGRLIRPGTVTAYEDYTLADYLDTDFRHINIGKPDYFKSYTKENGHVYDEWGIGRDVSAEYPTVADFPLANATSADEILNYSWPKIKDEGRIRGIGERAREWYENTDKAITATAANSGMFFEMGQFLRGHQQFMMDLCIEPEITKALVDKIADLLAELNIYYLEPIAPYIEWVEFTGDIGMQNAPFFSLDMFRNIFKDAYSRVFSAVKKAYPGIKILYHSCGSVRVFIEDLIETGVDILNPIQPLAFNMNPAEIKKDFGDRLAFHGAIDIQQAMPGTLDDTVNECRLRIDQMGEGGGYILSPSNHMLNDIPPENVIALYKTAKEYGRY